MNMFVAAATALVLSALVVTACKRVHPEAFYRDRKIEPCGEDVGDDLGGNYRSPAVDEGEGYISFWSSGGPDAFDNYQSSGARLVQCRTGEGWGFAKDAIYPEDGNKKKPEITVEAFVKKMRRLGLMREPEKMMAEALSAGFDQTNSIFIANSVEPSQCACRHYYPELVAQRE